MANFVYTKAKQRLLAGDVDLDEAGHDMRVLLVMTSTTADTDQDADTLSGITTLDEYDGSGYARQAIASQTTVEDETNNRGEFDGADVTFATLGAGTRQCQAAVIYRHVDGTAANDQPVIYIDTGGFPFSGNGGDVTISWNAEGILQAT
jgi:hypothetical protein